MHVCLITSGRPFEFLYGEEKFTISLGKWLSKKNYSVTIVGRKLFGVEALKVSNSPPTWPEKKFAQHRVLHLPYPIYVLYMLSISLAIALKVIAINSKFRISVLHAQDTGYGGLSSVIVAKVLRIPVVISSHGVRYATLSKTLKGIYERSLLPFEYWLDNVTSRNADLLIAVGPPVKEFFTGIIRKDKIRIIPIGIETSNFEANAIVRLSMRKQLHIKDEVVLGFIGRFSIEKNLFTLLEAFAKALQHADKMKLILVGSGPVEDQLRTLTHNKSITDKVIFTGIRHDINQLLSALDVFILPSYTEGCPTALLEAMASGKAIIASDIPAIREMVEDGEALLFNPYKPQQLKNLILVLYNNQKLREKLGKKAEEKAKQYDASIVFRKIAQIYCDILDKSAITVQAI